MWMPTLSSALTLTSRLSFAALMNVDIQVFVEMDWLDITLDPDPDW
jgi:hypothetical protein